MSDANEFQVDPRLDALLSRALGRGSLSRQQRQQHLERLGITPHLGGSAGRWRAPVVAGRPAAPASPVTVALPSKRRRRQWLELGAAVLAVVLVASLLVALFRDWNGDEGDNQLAASPEATATPRETREQLYVISQPVSIDGQSIQTTGRVSAIDPTTGEEFWSVEAEPRIDSALSPDGRRLFVADSGPDGDHLYALDTQTGRELWRQPVENRQWLKPGGSYSTLSVSPDGSIVSVYACEGCTGEIRSTEGRNWLARFDAESGQPQPDLEIPACRGRTFLGPAGAIYVICDAGSGGQANRLQIVDTASGQPVTLTYDVRLDGGFPETTGVFASVASPDSRLLYLAAGNRLTVIDMTRHAATRVQLDAGINVAQRMPFLTLSPDGGRLYIGSLDAAAYTAGNAEVNRVDVYDTASWEHLGQLSMGSPLTHADIAAAPDGDSVYGVFAYHPKTDDSVIIQSTIMRLGLDAEPVNIATRPNEEILRLFAGTVEVGLDAAPRQTPTPEPAAHERLYAVSHVLSTAGDAVAGRVTAYAADTGEIDYWIDTGMNPDAVLSPDGTRLFVAAHREDGDRLTSYDASTGGESWSIDVENRVHWQFGEGPTALAVSQDGLLLYVYSASAPGDYTIQVFDATNGRSGQTIDGVAGCTAQLFPSADGRSLYVVCLAERFAPQVIDLETMTSAGIMQGFGGVISGAAASADGRYLYITHDIDTELRLTVIDTNSRTIAEQRDIVHMASDPLHMLNITAVSPDGSRLFVGLGSQPEGEAGVANQLWVWDTAALHNDSQKIPAPEAITGWSLAPGPDNASAFAICGDAICRLSFDTSTVPTEYFVPRDNELLRVFTGRVAETSEPSDTDEDDTGLSDLIIPDNLPLLLSLSSRLPDGSQHERLLFNGDDGIVIEIDVRRWKEGETLDPPDRSTPVVASGLTVHVTPDPDGGWPRIALWHDQRFVYTLSVLSSPPDGWTQANLFGVVTAFETVTDARSNPPQSAAWDGSLYALSHEEGSQGVIELDPMTGEIRRRIEMIPYGNSYPHLEVNPEADLLAVAGSLPGEEMRLDVLIYRLSDFTLLQRVPVPKLIQAFGVGDGISLSPDGRFLYAYQYETPPDENGNNARYWLGTYDLGAQSWLADVELPGCGTVTRIDASLSPRVFVQCSQAGLRVVDTDEGATWYRIDSGSQVAWFDLSEDSLGWLTPDGALFSGGEPAAEDYHELIAGLVAPPHVSVPAGMLIATLPYARLGDPKITYIPLQPIGSNPTEIAVAELPWSRINRTIHTSAPFREIVFAGDEQFAFVTLVGADDFTTGIARIDLATGAETPLVNGFFGNLVAVASGGS